MLLLLSFSCSVVSDSLQPHRLQHARPPCPSPTPGAYSNSCPLSQWGHPTISYSVIAFSSCLQSFPASESLQIRSSIPFLDFTYTCCCCCCSAAKSLQSCPTLWDPIDGSPPGSPVPGILQARTLEWVAIFFSHFVPLNERNINPILFSNITLPQESDKCH